MSVRPGVKRYTKQQESEIRFNILSALQEMAQFNGIDINTIKSTPPYSFLLSEITSQKIAAELRKLIDSGMVVKGVVRGKPVRYMLRQTYIDLVKGGDLDKKEFGYGDYRDSQVDASKPQELEKMTEEESETVCNRILLSAARTQYKEMW